MDKAAHHILPKRNRAQPDGTWHTSTICKNSFILETLLLSQKLTDQPDSQLKDYTEFEKTSKFQYLVLKTTGLFQYALI